MVSRAQLAFEIETTEKQLFRIENGEINSGIKSFIKIARALDVPICDLFKKITLDIKKQNSPKIFWAVLLKQ